MIEIIVRNKIAKLVELFTGICGNSDYVIKFNFDEEWDAYETKTARFKWNSTYVDIVFTGNECAMPAINDAYGVEIGVYAGDLHTTTGAYLPMKKSILCDGGVPADPTPDVYAQIMELLNSGGSGGGTGTVKSVNGVEPDEDGNVDIEPTDDDAFDVLYESGIIDPVTDADGGALFTDADETIFSL